MGSTVNGAKNTFLFTSESVGEGHPDKIWYAPGSFPCLHIY